MPTLLLFVLGCAPGSHEPEDTGVLVDTGYHGLPELRAVSAACHAGDVSVRARTRGWASGGIAEVWDGRGGYTWFPLETIDFKRDQTCDVLQGPPPPEDTATDVDFGGTLADCASADLGSYTFLVQVWYEKGCAGVTGWGPEWRAAYNGKIEPPPASVVLAGVTDADCVDLIEERATEPADPATVRVDAVKLCTPE